MTFYLKYRPQKIEDLDLVSVREGLSKIIQSGSIPHAFLFSGSKGTGKTSSARILAKVINCESTSTKLRGPGLVEPCGECDTCLSIAKGNNIDVIEMDAASNRGIDDVRALRENITLAPVSSRKKIYIIDEAHMLTTEAANALLKTLEEPPGHVVFILATTNPEKLPDTINSRLTNVVFTKATTEELMHRLERITKGEKITASKEGLEIIARYADGSFRDAVKVLEQMWTNFEKITKENAEEFLFQTKVLQPDNLLALVAKKDTKSALFEIERVAKSNGSMKLYMSSLYEKLHQALLAEMGIGNVKINDLTKEEIINLLMYLNTAKLEMNNAVVPQLPLEIAIIKFCGSRQIDEEVVVDVKKTQTEEKVPSDGVIDIDAWNKLLIDMKQKNSSIEALLRASKLMDFDGKTLTLGVYYQFHKERLEAVTNRKILEDVAANIFGVPVKVNCLLTEKPIDMLKKREDVLTDPKDQDIIKAAKEIFS